MIQSRTMLSFPAGDGRFQVRAAAIIRRDGYLLVHRAVGDPFWGLPGGRVEFAEAGAVTVVREIAEEMGVTSVAGPLRFMVENLFALDQREMHEIGLYFDVSLTGDFPFSPTEIVHRSSDGGATLEFRWVPSDPATLARWNFVPPPLQSRLAEPMDFAHLVEDQRR